MDIKGQHTEAAILCMLNWEQVLLNSLGYIPPDLP